MAKTYRSKKAKGSRHESNIAKRYVAIGIEAKRMPLSGADSMLKGDIAKRTYDGWIDECKNQETFKIWEWWRQTVEQARDTEKPVLHATANNKPELTILKTDDWFDMRLELIELRQMLEAKQKEKPKKATMYTPQKKNKLIWELEMAKTKLNSAIKIAKREIQNNE